MVVTGLLGLCSWPGEPSPGRPSPGKPSHGLWPLGRGGPRGQGCSERGTAGVQCTRVGPATPCTPEPEQLPASVSRPAGRGQEAPVGLYIFLTGLSSEARKKQQSLPSRQPIC